MSGRGEPVTVRLALGLGCVLSALVLLELAPGLHGSFESVNIGLARTTEWLLGQLEIPVARRGAVLSHPDGFAYRITYVCSGLRPISVVAVTLLVVPAAWSWRLTGLALGVIGIEALNLCRLVHLYWLGVVEPDAFFTAHRVTWNIVAIVMVAGYLLLWLRGSRRRPGVHGQSTPAHART